MLMLTWELPKKMPYACASGRARFLSALKTCNRARTAFRSTADGLKSAVANERDLGVYFYWAPIKTRRLFSELVSSGLKGSGDYGVFAFGAYNGQTAYRPEANNESHLVSRISYPIHVGKQIIEPGIQAYKGKHVLDRASLSNGVKFRQDLNYRDERIAGTFVLYQKPFGILAEYNTGIGPEFNKHTDSIKERLLQDGFATFSYMAHWKKQTFIPFTRVQYYQGGKKHETDARSYQVGELEVGVEWQPERQFELVVMYTRSSRRFEDFRNQNNTQKGGLLRVQAKLNF